MTLSLIAENRAAACNGRAGLDSQTLDPVTSQERATGIHWPAAAICLLVSLQLGCTHKPTPMELASEFLFRKEYAAALAKCDEILEQDSDDAQAWILRGQINQAAGDINQALADFSWAIKVKPEDPNGYYFRADLYASQGEIEKQMADYKKGRELDPEAKLAYSNDYSSSQHSLIFDDQVTNPGLVDSELQRGESALDEPSIPQEVVSREDGGTDRDPLHTADTDGDVENRADDPAKTVEGSAESRWHASQTTAHDRVKARDIIGLKIPDATIPPHDDGEPSEPMEQAPIPTPITRFDMPTIPWPTQQRSSAASTGIRSLPDPVDDGRGDLPRGRFYLQNDRPVMAPTTGITSQRSVTTFGAAGVASPLSTGIRSDITVRNKFSTAPPAMPTAAPTFPNFGGSEDLAKITTGLRVLSTAIHGTDLRYPGTPPVTTPSRDTSPGPTRGIGTTTSGSGLGQFGGTVGTGNANISSHDNARLIPPWAQTKPESRVGGVLNAGDISTQHSNGIYWYGATPPGTGGPNGTTSPRQNATSPARLQ